MLFYWTGIKVSCHPYSDELKEIFVLHNPGLDVARTHYQAPWRVEDGHFASLQDATRSSQSASKDFNAPSPQQNSYIIKENKNLLLKQSTFKVPT